MAKESKPQETESEDDIVVLWAVTISKILDPDGNYTLQYEVEEEAQPWDVIGMLQVTLDVMREEAMDLLSGFTHSDDDEDDD